MLAKLSSKISFFIGGFLIVSIALLLIRHFLEPRYLGYTKEHWLEVYGQDFSSRSGLKLAPLSADQNEALEAFRFFKANGVSFLVEVASKDLNLSNRERSFINLNKLMPWNKPWKRQLSPYQDYLHEIISAKSLLMELGMPFSWAESHAEPLLKSTDPYRVSLGLNILACSTNQMDNVATYASKFLGHSDNAVHHWAQKTLAMTGDHAAIGIPKLIKLSPRYTLSGWILLKEWATNFSEIHDLLDQGMQSPDRLIQFKSAVVKMSLSDNPSEDAELIYSIICDEFDPNKGQAWSGMLGTLKTWPYNIDPLIPSLLEIVNEHNETVVHVAEIFAEHQIEMTPLHSKLHGFFLGESFLLIMNGINFC